MYLCSFQRKKKFSFVNFTSYSTTLRFVMLNISKYRNRKVKFKFIAVQNF